MNIDRHHLLPEELSRIIIDQLASPRYRPGERLSAIALSKALGVSTTPVREALNRLAGADLVEERHREGFYVAPLSGAGLAALYGVHGAVMGLTLSRLSAIQPQRFSSDVWSAFQSLTRQTGDIALIGVQQYLSDRLRPVRRLEADAIGGFPEISIAFLRAARSGTASLILPISEDFHERCRAAAPRLADRYSDPV